MRYPHILAKLRTAKWAIQPATLHAIRDALQARLDGAPPAPLVAVAPRAGLVAGAESADDAAHQYLAPGVAYLAHRGIIAKHLSSLETMCGGCDLETLETSVQAAVHDARTRHLILHLDTPGGTITGVPEFAARLRQWRAETGVQIIAYCDTLCASAGYWIASACDAIVCTTTADLGSIGVYMAAIDDSARWEKESLRMVLIKAGERKAEGHPGIPISPETIAAWQAEVDELYAMFTGDIIAARPQVQPATMQGQCFMGQRAIDVGLADGLVPGLPELVTLLTTTT